MPSYRYAGHTFRYKRYRRYHGPARIHPGAVATAAVAVFVLAAAHPHHGRAHAEAATVASIPTGGSYTPSTWAVAFLGAIGNRATGCNRRAIEAWESAEGGNWANSAHANPLDTTEREPGSHAINSVGVQAYTSWRSGLAATATTILNGRYPGILSALRAGDDAQAVANAVANSPWGTSAFGASC